MALEVTSGSGTGGEQSNPQSATGTNTAPALGGEVQPGTPTQQLTSGNGVSLRPQSLTTVNLSTGASTSTTAPAKPQQHHFNPVLLTISALFFVIAVGLFWAVGRSSKKYNQYD